jgi:hypothetical protein
MDFSKEARASIGAFSLSLRERDVLDLLGRSLRQVYGDLPGEPLPQRLTTLIARIENRESSRNLAVATPLPIPRSRTPTISFGTRPR